MIKFNSEKMRRYVESDAFLSFTWDSAKARGQITPETEDVFLEAYFNTYVLENSVACDIYDNLK